MYYAGDPQFESGQTVATGASTTPTLLGLGQASGIVVASARSGDIIPTPISTFRLYRAPNQLASWTLVDEKKPSPFSLWNNLFDSSPTLGVPAVYVVTTLDTNGAETAQSPFLRFTAIANPSPIVASRGLSKRAFGSYPVLGSDVYIDPVTREGVVGPNGDFLAVNGLELLAQDLRTRFITQQGELLLHPDFGLSRDRVIGSGQADQTVEAQILRTRFIETVLADPRVSDVSDVVIARTAFDAWTVDLTIIAIGVEDPQRLNLVFPYFQQ